MDSHNLKFVEQHCYFKIILSLVHYEIVKCKYTTIQYYEHCEKIQECTNAFEEASFTLFSINSCLTTIIILFDI